MTDRLAAMDIGTNSCRLLIADLCEGRIKPVFTALRTSRIGEGMTSKRILGRGPIERTINALQEYRQIINEYGVDRYRIVATSAVREAANAAFFLDQASKRTGMDIQIISGAEEARLNYLGVCHSVSPQGTGIIIDIGGGSTEFTYLPHKGSLDELCCHSIPLGAVRLTEQPCLLSEILLPMKDVLDDIKLLPDPFFIGVGGTITTIAAICQGLEVYDPQLVHGYTLTKDDVERIMFFLAAKNNEERKRVPGLQPERADIIVAGVTILWAILRYLEASTLVVSEADLLYGIILEMASL
ncbi:MAG TPA: Ppx/GppA family phosphatase [Syntrophaceticus sp.]|nr:Ppx/GppA family phosphatase [Syntrophaceticus sp.]